MDASWKSSEEIPSLEMSGAAQLPGSTSCLACSDDGRYLSLGHSQGLSVWCASSLICVADWLQDKLEMTSIQMTRIAEGAYLLGAVDDMGVARVFAYHDKKIHLLSVLNTMEDINKRSICLTFELSEGGHYGAASFSCNAACWLEIYHFPLKAWVKELSQTEVLNCINISIIPTTCPGEARGPRQSWGEASAGHGSNGSFILYLEDTNSSGNVSVKWSQSSVEAKVKPPKLSSRTCLEGQLDVSQTRDFLTYCFVQDVDASYQQWDGQSFVTQAGKTGETPDSPRRCNQHFLLPCGQFHDDCKEMSQSDLPVAVCLWWSGSHNLLQYVLQKAATKKKSNALPDVLLPNAKRILCSAVSTCTRYIALGLADAMVCVWDRKSGSPLSVVVLAEDSPFFRMHFVDNQPMSTDDSQTFNAVNFLVLCKSGEIHTVTTERGKQCCTFPLTKRLPDRPKDSGDITSITVSVPFLQCLMLVVQRNGKMFLQDIINNKSVCLLTAPTTHLIATPYKPVFTLNTKQQTLYIRGDQAPSYSASSTEGNRSQLLIFHLGQSEILKQYVVSFPHTTQQRTQSVATLEENCNQYLQQRALSVHERNKAITQTWKQLQESGVKMQPTEEVHHRFICVVPEV